MKANVYKIIHELWEKKQRVTHRDFMDHFNKIHPSDDTITKPTFSRLLQDFMENNGIRKYKNDELQIILREPIKEEIHKGICGRDELKNYVNDYLKLRKIYSPSPAVLDRIIGTITKETMCNPGSDDVRVISEAIGKDITSLQFVKDFKNNNRYSRFPPAYEGKLGVKKLGSEYKIMLQIKDIFQKEGIELSALIQLPDKHLSKELIEKIHPSEIIRSSKEIYAIHLLKYYVASYQDSIDAMVKCFIKSARLMRFRSKKSYDEISGKDSRSFLEQNNAQFQKILEAMKKDDISVLEDYKEFFELVAQKTGYYHNKDGYYDALASRCKYSRILSPISSLEFKGLDDVSSLLIALKTDLVSDKSCRTLTANFS